MTQPNSHSIPSEWDPQAVPMPAPAPGVSELMRWQSHQLLRGAREVQIEHQGLVYRLQVTSLGKLILTK